MQTCGDGLAVVAAADVVVLGHEVVVHLLEVGLLVGGEGLLSEIRSLPERTSYLAQPALIWPRML